MQINSASIIIVILIAIAGGAVFFFSISDGGTTPVATAPTADLNYTYYSENNTLTILHAKGESFRPSDTYPVALEVYAFPNTEEKPNEPTATIELPFSEGDSITIMNVNKKDRVLVIWTRNSNSQVVGNYSVQ